MGVPRIAKRKHEGADVSGRQRRASRLAVGFFVFPLVATVPSPDVKYVT